VADTESVEELAVCANKVLSFSIHMKAKLIVSSIFQAILVVVVVLFKLGVFKSMVILLGVLVLFVINALIMMILTHHIIQSNKGFE